MNKYKAGLIIAHPEEQKWNNVWKVFRFPNLTLPTLAALMPQEEWDIEIQDELVGPLCFERDYDLVLITVTTSVSAKSYEVASRFRRTGAKIVLGGIHPSVFPEESILHADAVVVGEAEATLPHLLNDLSEARWRSSIAQPVW
jgi:hypothetical protein